MKGKTRHFAKKKQKRKKNEEGKKEKYTFFDEVFFSSMHGQWPF
jgi:hypothetical protein